MARYPAKYDGSCCACGIRRVAAELQIEKGGKGGACCKHGSLWHNFCSPSVKCGETSAAPESAATNDRHRKVLPWTKEMLNIFQNVLHCITNGVMQHFFISAKAGSGKTTSMVELSWRILEAFPATCNRIVFLCFGKAIAVELCDRVPPGCAASTLHSLGFSALRQFDSRISVKTIDEGADLKAAEFAAEQRGYSGKDAKNIASIVAGRQGLIGKLKGSLIDPSDKEAIIGIIEHFSIDVNGDLESVLSILRQVMEERKNSVTITFDDMIYRAAIEPRCAMPSKEIVIVDEAQDLNACQIELLEKLRSRGAMIIAVGDPRQSIYGFRGADANAVGNLIKQFDMQQMPLNTTFRCPKSHVLLAQSLVPEIQAAPNAKEGVITSMTFDQMLEKKLLAPGTLCLSRKNAPLVSSAMRLIARGIPAIVRGRDLVGGIISLIRKMAKKSDDPGVMLDNLDRYAAKERQKLEQREANESAFSALADKIAVIHALAEDEDSVTAIIAKTENLFQDPKNIKPENVVSFSSIHQAKGLEAENVVILDPGSLPMSHPRQKPWEWEQELNIAYVAYTRSKDTLIFEVTEKGGFGAATRFIPSESPQNSAQ